jgi:hypothetical protein
MEGSDLITKVLPLVTIILVVVFVIALKVISRAKNKAFGNQSRDSLSGIDMEPSNDVQNRDRLKIKCPVLIERSQGLMKVSLKEITLNGAFLTCPNPLPIGELFPMSILVQDQEPLKFNAEVLWNNQNVAADKIVSRGMKVRFLRLSTGDRKVLYEIISKS